MVGSDPAQLQPRSARLAGPKVLQLAPGHWAGHMRIYHRNCKSLAAAGYAVELVAHRLAGEVLDRDVRCWDLGEYGQPNHGHRLFERYRRSELTYRLALSAGAALFHFYSPEFIPWAIRLRYRTGCPVIFDCMEDFEGYALQRRGIPTILRRPLAGIVRSQLRFAARHVDAITVADHGTSAMLQPFARRVLVVHNYPQRALFPDPGDGAAKKQYDLTYHGSIPRYHLETCLAIDDLLVAHGRRVSWRFIGRIPERAWFLAEVARRGAGHRFRCDDMIPHDRVAAEVQQARIGIIPLPSLPKFQNNIPQKLFEFMALRMPVVLSDLPPSRPFVGDVSCAMMVKPDDPAAYATAITRLLDDEALCRRMGAEGRRRFEEHYNWERESQKLIDLYMEMAQL